MEVCVLLSLLLVLGCVTINGVPLGLRRIEPGSCEDPSTKAAAELALTKINQDRKEGYIFGLHRISNAHLKKTGQTFVTFYLTLDVVETNCSVLSKKDWKSCEIRPTHNMPVYGQCKAAILIANTHGLFEMTRLHDYNCVIRPVPAARVFEMCPDCPALINHDSDQVQKTVSLSLEKFNKESGLANRFALLKISRATAGMAIGMYYNVEYSIQETICPHSANAATETCPLMDCEFAHKGFCKGSMYSSPTDDENIAVECEIYEPEAAQREKKHHLLGGETDHSHNDTHSLGHDQDHTHAADQTHTHDHAHDHTKSHSHHGNNQNHTDEHDHHHTHDHDTGSAHRHAHDHSHDHGVNHDHVHAHHAKAHNHTGDSPNHHHDYKHADGVHTHEHDHELALDHDHKHRHLHEHEHHHHHHQHKHETTHHDKPRGIVKMLPALGQPVTLPAFPDVPTGGHEVGEEDSLTDSVSPQCPAPEAGHQLVEKLFAEDPMFKPAA
ncbi:histidine-rich glycoprotein-like [Archocentrus centrarchus]|uniref:histidine-rich glycoprotein-like n=1 Tax=Archocentrus centrarchus TaxID=63155 RepID=UPI0011EA2E76|nr:histidine-rich glycoprotein-like [Archocentrus centrarchus]